MTRKTKNYTLKTWWGRKVYTIKCNPRATDAKKKEKAIRTIFSKRIFIDQVDLSDLDLRRIDLSYQNLSGAIFSGCNLHDADLGYCDLSYANFTGCDITGASFRNSNLHFTDFNGAFIMDGNSDPERKLVLTGNGEDSVLSVPNVGTRNDTLMAYHTSQGIFIRTGCFMGTVKEFAARVEDRHRDNSYCLKEYAAALKLLKVKMSVWK